MLVAPLEAALERFLRTSRGDPLLLPIFLEKYICGHCAYLAIFFTCVPHEETRTKDLGEVTCTGAGPRDRAQSLGFRAWRDRPEHGYRVKPPLVRCTREKVPRHA